MTGTNRTTHPDGWLAYVAPCVTCGLDRTHYAQQVTDLVGMRLVVRTRTAGHAEHSCGYRLSSGARVAGHADMPALVAGQRHARVSERHASTTGVSDYLARKPATHAEYRSNPCASYTPRASVAVTARGAAMVVRRIIPTRAHISRAAAMASLAAQS